MIRNVSIVFPNEAMTTGCEVEELGKDLYILRDHPLMSDTAMYGDTIEAVEESPGKIRFVKVVKKSESKIYNFILIKEIVSSKPFKELNVFLSGNDVFWQNDFGGCFACFVPPSCSIDIEHEINKIIT